MSHAIVNNVLTDKISFLYNEALLVLRLLKKCDRFFAKMFPNIHLVV